MAVSRGAVLFLFLLLLIAAEMGAIDAKMGVIAKHPLSTGPVEEKEKEKEKEKQEEKSLPKQEEAQCLSKSHQFKGLCIDSDKCAQVCMKESFPGGECETDMAIRKCFCKKPC